MISIAVVDDQRIMRIGLNEKLRADNGLQLLFLAENGEVFLEEMKSRKPEDRPQLVLMDIDMPGLNGIETVSIAKTIYPTVEFIMLTVFDDDDKIFEAIRAGATGYLLKDESTQTLIQSIKDVVEFQSVPFSPIIARKALQLFAKAQLPGNEISVENPLSERETEVLNGLVNGLDYKEIAEKMIVSPNTIRNHIANIYKKLHVTSKVDAVKLALRQNWI